MSKICIIIAFESLTCLTFTVLSAEALLYSVNGFQTSSWLKYIDVIEREFSSGAGNCDCLLVRNVCMFNVRLIP